MTTLTWPSILPCGQFDGYSYARKDLAVDTELETGRIRTRRRYSDAPASAQVVWIMTAVQFAYFEGWYKSKLAGRALPFNMVLNVGAGLAEHECKFIGPYAMQALVSNDAYRVTGQLEVKELQVWTEDMIDIVDTYIDEGGGTDGLFAFLDLFDEFVNSDLPGSEMGA